MLLVLGLLSFSQICIGFSSTCIHKISSNTEQLLVNVQGDYLLQKFYSPQQMFFITRSFSPALHLEDVLPSKKSISDADIQVIFKMHILWIRIKKELTNM